MTDDNEVNDIYAFIKENIKKRVREQLERHRIDPNMDPRRVIDIQIKQERERLERKIKHYEESDDENAPTKHRIELLEAVIKEWLPEFAEEIKSQYR